MGEYSFFKLAILETPNMPTEVFFGFLKLICAAVIVTSCWLVLWLASLCIDKILRAFVDHCENWICVKLLEGRPQRAANTIYDPGIDVDGVAV